ncbi:hypothetical protein ACWIGM_09145 [Bosea sp. NPDC055332]
MTNAPTPSADELRTLAAYNGAGANDTIREGLRKAATLIESQRATIERVTADRDRAEDKLARMTHDRDERWARQQAAEARVTAIEAEKAEREEVVLAGLTSDIAREIEAHDAFDCPDGWTYVRAANDIAQRLVERFGRVQALSRSSTVAGDGA